MQVLVVAVQNAVRLREDLGVATSGTTLLRNIGQLHRHGDRRDTIFATQLASRLASAFPQSARGCVLNISHPTTAELAKLCLPASAGRRSSAAYSSSLDRAFLVGAFISIIAFIASWFITELPMRTTIQSEGVGVADTKEVPARLQTSTVASGVAHEQSRGLPIDEHPVHGWAPEERMHAAAFVASPRSEVG